jgi:hypothetical protein
LRSQIYLDTSKYISEVWVVKEQIYHETKNMAFKQYTEYLDRNIKDLKERFINKYALNTKSRKSGDR